MKGYCLQVELTNHCNFTCKLCPHAYWKKGPGPAGNSFDREKGFMSEDLFRTCLHIADRHAETLVLGFFGEQMLHPRFFDLLEMVPNRRAYQFHLNTNWSMAVRDDFPLLASKVDVLKISLDSIRPGTFESLCPGGYVLTLDGRHATTPEDRVQALIEKTRTWLAFPRGARTHIIFVTSRANQDERTEFGAFWRPFLRKGDEVLMKTSLSYGGVVQDPYMTKAPCTVADEKRMTIAWNGDTTPCNLDVNLTMNSGTIRSVDDAARILKSEAWKAAIRRIRERQGVCANCPDGNNRRGLLGIP